MVMRQPKKGREEPALRPGSADPKDKNKIKRIGKKQSPPGLRRGTRTRGPLRQLFNPAHREK